MAKIRKHLNDQFSMKSNTISQDHRLSFKARGLFDFMWSMPEDWRFTVDSLVNDSERDGRDSIRVGLKELENFGYLIRKQVRLERSGVFTSDTEYNLFDDPANNMDYNTNTDDGKSNFGTDNGLSDVGKPDAYIIKQLPKKNKRDILLLREEVLNIYDEYVGLQDRTVKSYLKKEKHLIIQRIIFNLDKSVKNKKRYITTVIENEVRKYQLAEEINHFTKEKVFTDATTKEFSIAEKQIAEIDWEGEYHE